MSAAHHPAVIQAYTQHCEKNKIPLRVRPDHTCTNECPLLELRGPFPVFVCKDSCRIHDCGERCTAYIAAKNNEGYVCPLTGRCIDKPMLIHYLGPPRTDGKGYKHDNYVRMGRGVYTTKDNIAKRAALQKHAAAQKAVRETFCDIMFGKTRHRMYSAAKERVVNEMAKHLRQHKHAAVPIQEHIETLHTLVQKTGAALNPPAPKLDRAATERMCDAVFEYYKKIASLSGKSLPVTKRNAEVFTACICQRLSTGHAINGCTVIPKVAWFERHIPAEISFGNFQSITCRQMSKLNRVLQAALQDDRGRVRDDAKFVLPPEVFGCVGGARRSRKKARFSHIGTSVRK